MKKIVELVEYAIIDPITLENIISKQFPCWVITVDYSEDFFEISIEARKEDIASIEKILAKYI